MITLDIYESGRGYTALRVEVSSREDLRELESVFRERCLSADCEITSGKTKLTVAISPPPWAAVRVSEDEVLWSLNEAEAKNVASKISAALSDGLVEVALNSEWDGIVIELVGC